MKFQAAPTKPSSQLPLIEGTDEDTISGDLIPRRSSRNVSKPLKNDDEVESGVSCLPWSEVMITIFSSS